MRLVVFMQTIARRNHIGSKSDRWKGWGVCSIAISKASSDVPLREELHEVSEIHAKSVLSRIILVLRVILGNIIGLKCRTMQEGGGIKTQLLRSMVTFI